MNIHIFFFLLLSKPQPQAVPKWYPHGWAGVCSSDSHFQQTSRQELTPGRGARPSTCHSSVVYGVVFLENRELAVSQFAVITHLPSPSAFNP